MTWECSEVQERLDDYRIRNLPGEDRAEIEAHMARCETCARFMATLEVVEEGVAESRMDPLARRRIAVSVSRGVDPSEAPRRSRRALVFAAAGAIAFAALVSAGVVLFGGKDGGVAKGLERGSEGASAVPVAGGGGPVGEAAGDRLEISEEVLEGRRVMRMVAGIDVWLSKDARAEGEVIGGGRAVVRLEEGAAVAVVGEHEPDASVEIAAPGGAVVEATGTIFAVEARDGEEVATVLEGTVEVSLVGAASSRILEGGAAMGLGGESTERLARAEEVDRYRAIAFGKGAPDSIAAPTERAGDGEARRHRISSEDVERMAREAILSSRLDEAGVLVDRVASEDPRSVSTRNLLAKLARAYRRARLYERAAATYRRLIEDFPGSEQADSGLVALAQIEMDALGRPSDALEHFQRYIETAPGGVLAEAAWAGKVRALFAMGEMERVGAQARRYLELYPAGSSAAQMRKMRDDASKAKR